MVHLKALSVLFTIVALSFLGVTSGECSGSLGCHAPVPAPTPPTPIPTPQTVHHYSRPDRLWDDDTPLTGWDDDQNSHYDSQKHLQDSTGIAEPVDSGECR
jgi:hypothetical protein